jgi:HK97 family phage major capsid protein
MSYAKEQREKLPRLAASMQAIIDGATKQNNRGLTSDERQKFHALETAYTAVEDSIKIAERSGAIGEELRGVSESRISEYQIEEMQDTFRTNPRCERDKSPYAKAFSAFLRRGLEGLDQNQRQLMQSKFTAGVSGAIQNAQTLTTTGGGYLIPAGFSRQLEEAKKWFGGIAGVVDKFTTETGNPLPWPTVNDTANMGRILGVNTQVTETDIAFNQVTFNAYIGTSDLVLIPLALIEDAYFDMDALTARLLGTRLGRLYNNKCTVGSGNSEPCGIVTAAVAAGSTSQFASNSGAGVNGPSYADLVNLEHTVDPAYRFNPATSWMFNDLTLKALKKLVDGNNRPLWQPGLTASFRDGALVDLLAAKPLILDHPYIVNQDMPVPAASAKSILFGDMQTFKVREVAGGTTVMRLVERYADYLQVGFIAFQRFDSNLVDAGTHPIAVGINAAS